MPAINAGGTIAFRGVVADGRFSSGIFLAPPEGGVEKVVGVGETTGAGRLAQLRDPVLADDDGVIVPASLIGGPPGLFRVTRARTVAELALLDEATDLGGGFRFIEPSVRDNAEGAIFLGLREGIFVASGPGQVSLVAMLGEPTPLGGRYQQFDPPAAGAGGRIVFAAAVLGPGFRRALFLAGPAGAVPLLKTGDGAPGGGSIRDFFVGVLDAAARVSVGPGGFAFQAELARTSSATGLFLRLGRRRLAVARADEHAPGGGRYSSFGTPAHLGGRRAAFVARLTGTASNLGVFLKSGRRTRALARAGRHIDRRRRVRQASPFARWSTSALVRGSSWSVGGRGTSSSPAAMPHPTAVVSRTSTRRSSPPIASSSTRPSRAALTPKESSASPAPRRRRPRRSRPSPGSVVPHPAADPSSPSAAPPGTPPAP